MYVQKTNKLKMRTTGVPTLKNNKAGLRLLTAIKNCDMCLFFKCCFQALVLILNFSSYS